MYIRLVNQLPEKYSTTQLRRDNPNTSFPVVIPDTTLAEYDVYPLASTEPPAADTDSRVEEGTPVLVGDQWTQTWVQVPLTPEEIADREALLVEQRKQERTSPNALLVALEVVAEQVLAPNLDTLSVETILKAATLFEDWAPDKTYAANKVLNYNGVVLKVVQAHTSQADWLPDTLPALYTAYRPPGVASPWVQPQGAHDAYGADAQVTHNGQTWINTYGPGNVWEPGVFGWAVV